MMMATDDAAGDAADSGRGIASIKLLLANPAKRFRADNAQFYIRNITM
jgi:hypothetical protein